MSTDDRPTQIGSYEILESLAGSDRVFRATDPSTGRVVAVKVAPKQYAEHPDRIEAFHRDAQAVAKIDHPNVIHIFDQGEEAGVPFVAMEFIEGTTLANLMRRRRLTLQEALAVFKGVCRGLEAAHQQGIVHRELSPDNVLVSEDLRVVKLADFGLVTADALVQSLGNLTTGQVNMGSLHYMSPEQASRAGEVDHRTDIYSAGVLFYELLTGRVPVGRFSLPSQLNNEVPPEVDPVILRCLETRAADRYQTASQLLQALGRVEDRLRLGLMQELQGLSSSTSKILLRSTSKVLGSKGPMVLAALLGVVVIAVLLFLFLSRGDEAAPNGTEGRTDSSPEVAEPSETAPPAELSAADGAVGDPEAEAEDAQATAPGATASLEPPTEGAAQDSMPVPQPPVQSPARVATPAPAETAAAVAERAAAERLVQANEDLRVAMDKFAASLWDPAIADLQSIIAQYGDHPRLPEVYLTVGKAHENKGAAQQALASYVEVQSRFPSSEEAIEAKFRQANLTTGQRGRQDEARGLLNDLLRDHPQSPYAAPALAAKAAIEKEMNIEVVDPQLGRVPAALQSWHALVETYPNHPAVERALWELGQLWGDQRNYQRSAESYGELGRRFPRTAYEAWWEAGQVYDRRLNDRVRAIAAYENVPQSSPHYRDAQKRIQRLD
jgi:serine/threonine protein kinase/tetratricopeptide (TPR) repeat protein